MVIWLVFIASDCRFCIQTCRSENGLVGLGFGLSQVDL